MSEGIGRKEVERSSQVINDGREDRIQEEIVARSWNSFIMKDGK